ncbi:MAG: PhzF family phenazine biosynthesis isomerase [bacterium]|nr:PhzF family phenazine biosynthesis isomerase [bacterium]
MERIVFFQIDAFTCDPFRGNPAAVCLLDEPAGAEWMQPMAAEMNLSETAFVSPREDGYDLRWFTPTCEVDLCGHATLASAHALWESGRLPTNQTARFFTRSGWLAAKRAGEWVEMDFPALPVHSIQIPYGLADALGVEVNYIGGNGMDFLVEVDSADVVINMRPDLRALMQFETRGVIVTSQSDSDEFDFVSRFFAPAAGVDEDPVTGSAHCSLAEYWGKKLSRDELAGFQASRRGGVVRMKRKQGRVLIYGQAATVFEGVLTAAARPSTSMSRSA